MSPDEATLRFLFPDRFVLVAFAAAPRNFLTELESDRVSANKAIYAPSLSTTHTSAQRDGTGVAYAISNQR